MSGQDNLNPAQMLHSFYPLHSGWNMKDIDTDAANELITNGQGRTRVRRVSYVQHAGDQRGIYEYEGRGRMSGAVGMREGNEMRWYSTRGQLTDAEYARSKAG